MRKFYLTDRFFAVWGFCQLMGIVSLVFPLFFYPYLLTWPLLLLLVFQDFLRLRKNPHLSVRVQLARTLELGQTTPVTFTLTATHQENLSYVSILFPALKTLQSQQKHLKLTPPWQHTLPATAVALGYEKISELQIHHYSAYRFWFCKWTLPVEGAEFRVIPTRKKISEKTFREMAKQTLFYQGNRQIIRARAPEQFHSMREYQYPDSIRHIDAKKSAKLGQLMTRIYDSFLEHHLILALDVGRSMCGKLGNSYKQDYYLAACLSLAQNAQSQHDRVSFFAFSQKIHHTIPSSRRFSSFLPLFKGEEYLQPREEESDFELIYPTLRRLTGQRSIVLILADISRPSVQRALLKSLKPVLTKHLTVVVSLIDNTYSLDSELKMLHDKPLGLEAYHRLLYAYWLNENMHLFQNELARTGGGVLMVTEQEWLSAVTRLYGLLRQSMRI